MKTLVVGYGSAGARHARILKTLGNDVAIVSQRDIDDRAYSDIGQALDAMQPDYVVVATHTHHHLAVVTQLASAGFDGTVMVEKPLFHETHALPQNNFSGFFVAYNLRWHPVVAALRQRVGHTAALSAQAYVGQYLPAWRPGRDYRQGYSASRVSGGGALRDLSHELDYLTWILGPCSRLASLGGHFSHLEIDSDDVFAVLMQLERCPVVALQMNYLDRVCKREVVINTDEHTYSADLVAGTLSTDGDVEAFEVDVDATWRAEHVAVMTGDTASLCTATQGLRVNAMIDAAERAATEGTWTRP